MAKDSKKYLDCLADLRKYQAQALAAQAWVSMEFKQEPMHTHLLSHPDSLTGEKWRVHLKGAQKPHGGIVCIVRDDGVFVHEPVCLDDLCSNWLKSNDPWLRQFARDLIRWRNSLVEGEAG